MGADEKLAILDERLRRIDEKLTQVINAQAVRDFYPTVQAATPTPSR